ncbi:MAG: chorismate mutase [Aristaeellaceae bacterium]
MRELEELRAELDGVDRELVRLFERRMALSREVARYKLAHGLPVLDASREEQVLASRADMLDNPALAEDVRALYTCIMALSRGEQERLLKEAGV